jgi:hypothetical protein
MPPDCAQEVTEMAGKQVDFPPDQRHSPALERNLVLVSVVLIILVVIAIFTVG